MELLRMLAGPIIIVGLLICCLPILMRCHLSCVENNMEALIKRKGGDVGMHAGLLNFLPTLTMEKYNQHSGQKINDV